MNKLVYLSLFAILVVQNSNAQSDIVLSGGAKMIVSNATYINNINDMMLQGTSALTNNGTVALKGNFTNNATAALGNGLLTFNGPSAQTIGGSTTTNFGQLGLSNNVQLAAPAFVAGSLAFSSGKLTLGNYNLTIGPLGTISGYGSSKYAVASGTGRLVQNCGASDKVFPVGTASSYVPLTLNNQGTADDFGVRVFADVLNNGTSGGTIAAIDHVVDMSWVTDEGTPGGSNLTATCQWNASNEGSLFDRTQSGVGSNSTGTWNPQGDSTRFRFGTIYM